MPGDAEPSSWSNVLFYRLNGAYSEVADDEAAFSGGGSPRYAIFIIGLAAIGELLAADRGWVRSFWEALRPYAMFAPYHAALDLPIARLVAASDPIALYSAAAAAAP
jgi:hypothetical protein